MSEIRISNEDLQKIISKILVKNGVSSPEAAICAEVISMSTADGVISHGIGRLPRLVSQIRNGIINKEASTTLLHAMGSREIWDGHSGIGIVNAVKATDRALELAEDNGMGMVSLRNNSHWLRGGTYGWRAADRGYALFCWTNTIANMPPWGGRQQLIGNNPLVMALPGGDGKHFVLDMAMSQYSYGALGEYSRKGHELPTQGGWDSEGNITSDPQQVLETGRVLPIGFWKGSSLSIMLDLLSATLSLGHPTGKILPGETNVSQTFLALSLNEEMALHCQNIQTDLISAFEASGSPEGTPRYPGQRTFATRQVSLKEGIIIPESLWNEVLEL